MPLNNTPKMKAETDGHFGYESDKNLVGLVSDEHIANQQKAERLNKIAAIKRMFYKEFNETKNPLTYNGAVIQTPKNSYRVNSDEARAAVDELFREGILLSGRINPKRESPRPI